MFKLVFLFASAFLVYSASCGSSWIPDRVYEFGTNIGEVTIIKTGAFRPLQKEATIMLQAPIGQEITYVKVIISNSLFEPIVLCDPEDYTVTITYGPLQEALGVKYVVSAKTVYK